jgi:hypothetical protein
MRIIDILRYNEITALPGLLTFYSPQEILLLNEVRRYLLNIQPIKYHELGIINYPDFSGKKYGFLFYHTKINKVFYVSKQNSKFFNKNQDERLKIIKNYVKGILCAL